MARPRRIAASAGAGAGVGDGADGGAANMYIVSAGGGSGSASLDSGSESAESSSEIARASSKIAIAKPRGAGFCSLFSDVCSLPFVACSRALARSAANWAAVGLRLYSIAVLSAAGARAWSMMVNSSSLKSSRQAALSTGWVRIASRENSMGTAV